MPSICGVAKVGTGERVVWWRWRGGGLGRGLGWVVWDGSWGRGGGMIGYGTRDKDANRATRSRRGGTGVVVGGGDV